MDIPPAVWLVWFGGATARGLRLLGGDIIAVANMLVIILPAVMVPIVLIRLLPSRNQSAGLLLAMVILALVTAATIIMYWRRCAESDEEERPEIGGE